MYYRNYAYLDNTSNLNLMRQCYAYGSGNEIALSNTVS